MPRMSDWSGKLARSFAIVQLLWMIPLESTSASEEGWLCSTPQVTNQDAFSFGEDFDALFLWSSDLELTVETSVQLDDFVRMDMLQVGFSGDAWQPEEGLSEGAPGIVLGVKFLDGSEAQINSVLSSMTQWVGEGAGHPIRLKEVTAGYAQIRISFQEANWSAIGRQALMITDQQTPTMKLMDVSGDSSAAESSLIAHEFGHALGLRHEHQHPEAGIRWDEEVVMEYFTARNWSKRDVRKNIFEALSFSYKCPGAPEFDDQSIMIYPIKNIWTLDDYEVPAPSDIQARDLQCVASLYN